MKTDSSLYITVCCFFIAVAILASLKIIVLPMVHSGSWAYPMIVIGINVALLASVVFFILNIDKFAKVFVNLSKLMGCTLEDNGSKE